MTGSPASPRRWQGWPPQHAPDAWTTRPRSPRWLPHHLAAELERSELALIEAARESGATWTRIANVMGARNRQTAQKRHADLARRCPRAIRPWCSRARQPAPSPATPARRRPAVPMITDAIITEGRYELVRAPGHAETRAWHVIVGGRLAGLVTPYLARGAQPSRLGACRYRRNRAARHRDRQRWAWALCAAAGPGVA
jgi:hypothetical protein